MRRLALGLMLLLIAAGVALGAFAPGAQQAQAATPIVNIISPTSGPVAGGTSVTITGSGFTGATSVLFQGTSGSAAASFTVNSDTQITAISPASPIPSPGTGTVDVVVVTPSGSSPITGADKFTYTSGSSGSGFTGLVFVVSQDGNDANTCLLPSGTLPPTATFACATIQGAIDKTRDGDTVLVLSGVYDVSQPIEVSDSIAIVALGVLATSGSTATTLTPTSVNTITTSGTVPSCSSALSGTRVVLRSAAGQPIFHVTASGSPILFPFIAGFTLGGTTSLVNPGAIQLDGSSYAEIQCNIVGQEDLPNGIGILLRNADNAFIVNNTIHGSSQFPVSPTLGPTPPVGGFGIVTAECLGNGHSDDALIAYNLVTLNSNAGLYFCSDGGGGHIIVGNTVRGNGRGIVLQDANDVVAAANAVQDNYYDGFELLGTTEDSIITNNSIESQDGANSNGILLAGDGLLFPLDNAIVANFFRRNTTNITISGARRTLIGVDKLVQNTVEGKIGPVGHVFIADRGNVMSADGNRSDIVISLGNTTGQTLNGADPEFGQPVETLIKQNTLLANGPCGANSGCAVRLTAGVTVNVDATQNEWGVTSNQDIRAEIWDKYRDPALGQVVVYCAEGSGTGPCPTSTAVATTPTAVPFPAPPQFAAAAGTVAPIVAGSNVPPPNFPATPTPAATGAQASTTPTTFIDPSSGHYYAALTLCVNNASNAPVANDRLAVMLQGANGGTLGVVMVTTDANGCFVGNVSATGGAAEVAPANLSITDPSGAVTNLNVQAGSPLYKPPAGSVTTAGAG